MADEVPTSAEAAPEPAVADETSPPENDASGEGAAAGAEASGDKPRGKRERKEQVPIEELYDLSKPIKRVSAREGVA